MQGGGIETEDQHQNESSQSRNNKFVYARRQENNEIRIDEYIQGVSQSLVI